MFYNLYIPSIYIYMCVCAIMRLYTIHNSEVSHCSVEFIGSNKAPSVDFTTQPSNRPRRPRVIDVHHATGGSPGAVRGDGCEGGGGIGSPGHVSNGLGSPAMGMSGSYGAMSQITRYINHWEFQDPKWSYCTIFCGDIPLGLKNRPNIYGLYGR